MNNVTIRPMTPEDMPVLLELSRAWADEKITYGYAPSDERLFGGYRCWVAELNGAIAGYAAGQMETAQRDSDIQKIGDRWFELEELYVSRSQRSMGIGRQLLERVEADLRRERIGRIMLSAANRDWESLLSFYVRNGMTLHSARIFKEL